MPQPKFFVDAEERGETKRLSLDPITQGHFSYFADLDMASDGKRIARSRKIQELNSKRADLINRRHHYVRDAERQGYCKMLDNGQPDPTWLDQFDKPLADVNRQIEELHATQITGSYCSNILEFLAENANRDIRPVEAPAPIKLGKGADAEDVLSRARQKVDAAEKEAKRVQVAPRPLAEVREKIISELDSLERRGKPNLQTVRRGYDIDGNGNIHVKNRHARIGWPTSSMTAGMDGERLEIFDAVAFNLWLLRPQIEARLLEQAEAESNAAASIPESDKAGQLAKARAAVIAARRQEELVVRAIEAAGMSPERRCREPLILLQAEFVNPAR